MIIDNKAHARKGKSLVEFSAEKYSSNLAKKIQNLQNLLSIKISFFALYHLRRNDVAHQAAQLKYE